MQKSQKQKKGPGSSISGSIMEVFTTLGIFAPHGAAVLLCLHRCKCVGNIYLSVDKLCKQWIKHCNSALSCFRWPMIFQYLQSSCMTAFLKKVMSLSDGLLRAEQIKYLQLQKTYFSITRSQTKYSMGLSTWQWHSFARAAGQDWCGRGTERRALDSCLLHGL